ncbi:MAG: SLC13 family permease [Nitrospirae bacterium]|nr:SLC13 family permease [Nitrospirota bacterium]
MTFEMILVLGLVLLSVILFATEKLPVDLVALIIMALLLSTGLVTPEDGISGFSNTATVTVGAMFVLSAALYKTGAVNFIGVSLAAIGKHSFWLALIILMVGIGMLSAFINNTAAVAVFLPITLGLAREINVSPSKLLMPLSFASMFGGVCTLIGTSTNILVSSIVERHGEPAFTMFEFTPLGLVLFGAGLLYVITVVRFIPNRRTPGDLTQTYGMGDYLTEIVLLPEAKTVGKTIQDSPLIRDVEIAIMDVFRNGQPIRPLSFGTVLEAGDVLRVHCNVEKIRQLQERAGIRLRSDPKPLKGTLESGEPVLVEAVIAPNSPIEGRTLRQTRFFQRFNAAALAIRHRGEVMHEQLETTRLQAGDVLLLEVRRENLDELKERQAFIFVTEVGLPEFRKHKILPAVAIVSGVVLTAALGIFPIVVSAIIGSVLLILTKCITLEEAYTAIDWKVIFLLAGVLTLGIALEKTGAAALISNLLIGTIGAFGPVAIVSALYLLTSLLTEMMSNNATAALLAPIAIVTAESLGLDARPFLMAVTYAASASFMTPVGYQTNTLIYGAGQYKFSDFLRVGTPLNILFWLLATILIPYFWPFHP